MQIPAIFGKTVASFLLTTDRTESASYFSAFESGFHSLYEIKSIHCSSLYLYNCKHRIAMVRAIANCRGVLESLPTALLESELNNVSVQDLSGQRLTWVTKRKETTSALQVLTKRTPLLLGRQYPASGCDDLLRVEISGRNTPPCQRERMHIS